MRPSCCFVAWRMIAVTLIGTGEGLADAQEGYCTRASRLDESLLAACEFKVSPDKRADLV
jgi:hypothetical protein